MNEPEAAAETRRWLRYALDDLDVAGQIARFHNVWPDGSAVHVLRSID